MLFTVVEVLPSGEYRSRSHLDLLPYAGDSGCITAPWASAKALRQVFQKTSRAKGLRTAWKSMWDKSLCSTVHGHYARVFDVAFAPTDSSLLASASDDDTCKVWRVSDSGATLAASFHGHQDSVLRVNWAASGNLLASASADSTVRVWHIGDTDANEDPALPRFGAEELLCLEGHPEEVYGCEFLDTSTGAMHLATCSEDKVYLWDVATGCQLDCAGAPLDIRHEPAGYDIPDRWQDGHVFSLAAQPDSGSILAGCCSDGSLRTWAREGASLEPLCALRLRNAMGSSCAWHRDRFHIALTFISGDVAVVDIRTWAAVWEINQRCPTFGCCYVPGASNRLAVCGPANSVSVYDTAADGPKRAEHVLPEAPSLPERNLLCIAASADGCAIAASGNPFPSSGSNTTAELELSPGGQAEEDGMFISSGLEGFGRGGPGTGAEHVGVEHRQAAKQSKWSPVTLWRQEA